MIKVRIGRITVEADAPAGDGTVWLTMSLSGRGMRVALSPIEAQRLGMGLVLESVAARPLRKASDDA